MGDSGDAEEKEQKRKKKYSNNGACCAAINCGNSKKTHPKLSFFRFPLDEERSREWVKQTQRPDILKRDATYLYHNLKLCSEHFEDRMFLNNLKNRLHKHAVPTLFEKPDFHSSYKKVRIRKRKYKCVKLSPNLSSSERSQRSSGTSDKEPDSNEDDSFIEEVGGVESSNKLSAFNGSVDSCSGTGLEKSQKINMKDVEPNDTVSPSKRPPRIRLATSSVGTSNMEHFNSRENSYPRNGSSVQLTKKKPKLDSLSGALEEIHNLTLNKNTFKKDPDDESDTERGCLGSDRVVQLPDSSLFLEFASPKRQVLLKLPPTFDESELRSNSLEDLLRSLSEMKLLAWDAIDRLRAFKAFPHGLERIPVSLTPSNCRAQFTEEVNKFATSLYINSPEAYDFVSKVFKLPDKNSVHFRLQSNDYRPGFTKKALAILKNKIGKSSSNKLCCIMFDFVDVMKQRQFDRSSGSWVGHEDLGGGLNSCDSDEIPLATEILMFTAVGLGSRWKLPFGYFPIGKLSGGVLKNLVTEAILILEACGLDVRALTCRGCVSSVEMLKILGCNICEANAYSSLITSICHPSKLEHKIYIIFSIKQSQELLKNLIEDKSILRSPVYGKIKWMYFRQMFEKSEDSVITGLDYMKFCSFQRVISLCKPGFSTLLVTAFELAGSLGVKDFQGSQGTFSFIADVVRGLLLLNSKHFSDLEGNPPICLSTLHEQVESISDIAERLFQLELLSGNCVIEGGRWMSVALFVATLKSVANLANDLLCEDRLHYFPTYRINLDHFDMVLSKLQRIGDWALPPTVLEFQNAYKHLFEGSSESMFHNYDFEGEDLTVSQGEIYQVRSFSKQNLASEDIVNSCDFIDLDIDITNRARQLTLNVSRRLSCPDCVRMMIDMKTELDDDPAHDFQKGKYISNVIRPSKYITKLMIISERILKREMLVSDKANDEWLVSYIFREYSQLLEGTTVSHSVSFHRAEEPYHVICLSKVLIRNIITSRLYKRKKFRNHISSMHLMQTKKS